MTKLWVVARHDTRWLLREPQPLVVLLVMPLVLIAFMRPLYDRVLAGQGRPDLDGAALAVPGLTAMFATFGIGIVVEGIYHEYGWRTWQRLAAMPVGRWELLAGKVVPTFVLLTVQMTVLFGVGWLALGLVIRGSVLAVGMLIVAFALCVVAAALALAAVCNSRRQAYAYERVLVLFGAGFGGALVPLSLLPDWMQTLGRITPTYWAVRGFRTVVIDGGGVGSVWLPVTALLALTTGFGLLAVWRFRFAASKAHWT